MTFIVTGTGHSGTGWASRLFTALGHACGHERWLTYRPYTGMDTADSSWMAVPRLPDLPGVPVVHLVRDPAAVLSSFLRSGTYRDPGTKCPYTRYTYRKLPRLHDAGDELGRCIIRTCAWDQPVAWHDPRMVVRIEDCAPDTPGAVERVQEMVAFATWTEPPADQVRRVLDQLGSRVNAHARHANTPLPWDRVLAHPLGEMVVERARTYGYPAKGGTA